MDILEKLYEIAVSLQEKAEALRAEESSNDLSYIISISPELSDKEDATYRINVDYYDGIADKSLEVLLEESLKPVLGDVKIKQIVDNGRQYEDGYTYYSAAFYI